MPTAKQTLAGIRCLKFIKAMQRLRPWPPWRRHSIKVEMCRCIREEAQSTAVTLRLHHLKFGEGERMGFWTETTRQHSNMNFRTYAKKVGRFTAVARADFRHGDDKSTFDLK